MFECIFSNKTLSILLQKSLRCKNDNCSWNYCNLFGFTNHLKALLLIMLPSYATNAVNHVCYCVTLTHVYETAPDCSVLVVPLLLPALKKPFHQKDLSICILPPCYLYNGVFYVGKMVRWYFNVERQHQRLGYYTWRKAVFYYLSFVWMEMTLFALEIRWQNCIFLTEFELRIRYLGYVISEYVTS